MNPRQCVAVVLLLVACGDDAASCPNPAATTAQALIGPAGGTVELAGGGKVEIPEGALTEDTLITVTEVPDPKPLPLGLDAAGKAYAFKPHGKTFAQAVTISVPIADGDAAEVSALKLEDDADTSWAAVIDVDKESDKLNIQTTGFSIYVAARPRRGSGVIVLPDGAIILPATDAGLADGAVLLEDAGMDAASGTDAAVDGAMGTDAATDAATDAGCEGTDAGCPVGDVVQLVLGSGHGCARYSLGRVYCWGTSFNGETGQGSSAGQLTAGPVQLFDGTLLDDVTQISANPRGQHTCARRGDGTVVCWGANTYGQCGSDAQSPALRAYNVPGISGAIAVSAGSAHTCAVLGTGAALCWGNNTGGQLSIGDTMPSQTSTPTAMVERDPSSGGQRAIADAVDVVAGMGHSCVVHTGRTRVSCAGTNATGGGHQGMLGRGAIGGGSFPIADAATLPNGTVVDSIHIGAGFYASHTCVLAAGSRPICWGTNTGLQIATAGGAVAIPTTLDAYYTQPQAIALGSDFTCVSYIHGTRGPRIACQGDDGVGQLGDGMSGGSDAAPDDVVASMDGLTFLNGSQVEAMAAGLTAMCIKIAGGGVSCWGTNQNYVFGNGEAQRFYADPTMVVTGLP